VNIFIYSQCINRAKSNRNDKDLLKLIFKFSCASPGRHHRCDRIGNIRTGNIRYSKACNSSDFQLLAWTIRTKRWLSLLLSRPIMPKNTWERR
jgi:hypothetical protein